MINWRDFTFYFIGVATGCMMPFIPFWVAGLISFAVGLGSALTSKK